MFTIEILNEKLHFLFGDRETVPNFLRFSGQYMISEIQENLWKICHSLCYFSEHFCMAVFVTFRNYSTS